MEEESRFWLIDGRILEHFKFPEFDWWELALVFIVLAVLGSYFLLAVYLDRRSRAAALRKKRLGQLEQWLESWHLEADELEALEELAGDDDPLLLHRMLRDPSRFERRVHEAISSGTRLPFVGRLRENLGYTSANFSIPVVSTRQLLPGDHVRFIVWEGARPRHHYGIVSGVDDLGLWLQLTEDGFNALRGVRGLHGKDSHIDLFYLRGNDMEYGFPLQIRQEIPQHNRLQLTHQLILGGHRARFARLPILRPFNFRLRSELEFEDEEGEIQERGEIEKRKGVLLEMSEGGFSLVLDTQAQAGHYIDFSLPAQRGKTIPIRGRILECRAFGNNKWLARCEMRGVSPSQRNVIAQLLRLAWRNRMEEVSGERRKPGARPGPARAGGNQSSS